MFHSVLPIDRLTEMSHFLEFQRKVLELCIAVAEGRPKNIATFEAVLGAAPGQWFWTTLQANTKSWDQYFDTLNSVLEKHLSSCNDILAAFDNDIQFQDYLTDEHYRFLFPQLPQEVKPAIKGLFEYFYFYSRETGYLGVIHGTPDFKLTRKAFIKSYTTANGLLNVCPVCDKEISDSDNKDGTAVCDLDHFFPISQYPFLSMHPYNLIPTCKECNETYKGATNILLDSSSGIPVHQSFLKIYHPHKQRSISDLGSLSISGLGNQQQPYQFGIEDSQPLSSYRIQSAVNAYDLLNRWTDRFVKLPNVKHQILNQARMQVRERAQSNSQARVYSVPEMLRTLEYFISLSKEAHYASIWKAYLELIRNNPDEQALFYREYTGQPSPRSLE